MVMHQHLFCEIAKLDLAARRRADDEKNLILLGGHASLGERRLAEGQESAHGKPEASKSIIDFVSRAGNPASRSRHSLVLPKCHDVI
ncbi:hypothetical protein [Rhizobium sp. Rhizsp82]|uniref:hypothetical protein n=1 Tax=Rhizobium sp. Rhizsp82 TaxID=3243057 RepID=UPI0039B68A99